MNPLSDRADFGRADAEEASRAWWIFLLVGIASLVFGGLILAVDWSIESLGVFVGVLFVLQGLSLVLTPPLEGGGRWSNVGAGAIAAGVGIVLIAWPDKGVRAVGVFVGIFVLTLGVLHIAGAVSNRHVPNWWLLLILGLVEVPIGVWAMRRPGATIAVIVTLTGLWSIAVGIYQCLMAFELRKLPKRLAT